MMKNRISILIASSLLVLSCGSDATSPTGGTGSTIPTASSPIPADGATNVPRLTALSVVFSEAMDPATITTSTFTLSFSAGGPVSGNVVLNGNTAIFTATSPLNGQTGYTATVTTGATDLAGNALASSLSWSFTTALALVIGDIEGDDGQSGFCTPTTLAIANSINVGSGISGSGSQTFAALKDTIGFLSPIVFVFDVGGFGGNNIICNGPGDALESDGIRENGPILVKPWHIEGLTPGGSYTMTFTGGTSGGVRRNIRMFVDVDGNGTLEASEVEDLIGLGGVVETRTFGQPITADTAGVIIGEYWGGSTNDGGNSGTWRGWTIKSAP